MDAHKSAAIRLADAERCRGGQAAIEFISYLSFFLVLFAVSVILFIDQQRADVIEKRTMLADEVASRFAERLNFALYAGDGFFGNFSVPEKLLSQDYDVRIMSNRQVFVNWSEGSRPFAASFAINTNNITGGSGTENGVDAASGVSWISLNASKGRFQVENTGNRLLVSQR